MTTLTKAAQDVLAERYRQISTEGWTPEHDDEHHDSGELSAAASAYAWAASCQVETDKPAEYSGTPPAMWPWDSAAWNLKGERSNLVRAGALILAEIERLDRTAGVKEGHHQTPSPPDAAGYTTDAGGVVQAPVARVVHFTKQGAQFNKVAFLLRDVPVGAYLFAAPPEALLRQAADRDADRWRWYMSDAPKDLNKFLQGVREHWTMDQWNAWADAGIAAAAVKEPKP